MTNNDTPDDDKKLFRDAMRYVTPLKKDNKHSPTPPIKPVKTIIPRPQKQPESIAIQYDLSSHYTDEVGPESILSYHIQGLSKKRLIELRKGEIHWEGRLDLHGMTTPQAQERLCQFILQQSELGHRCILIIHGKGSPTGNAPILKNVTNHWLKQLPQILAFHSALPRDGGPGALYVLLKRNCSPSAP